MFAAINAFLTRSSGYFLNKSLRFRGSASAYLNRTASASISTYTISMWVKRGTLTSNFQYLFSYLNSGSTDAYGLAFNQTTDTLYFYNGTAQPTTATYRDVTAWYHLVLSNNAGSFTLYVNGVSAKTGTAATIPSGSVMNLARYVFTPGSFYFDGELAEVNFVDGQALTAASFGATGANSQWLPIKYAGTYGTNGFYLPFTNTTSTTTLVADSSGNGNNWTPNNISLTAGITYDSLTDVPTIGGTASNYAVWNPLWQGRTNIPINGNLDYPASSVGIGTIDLSTGSFYWEITATGGIATVAVYSTSVSSSVAVALGLTYGFRFNGSTGAFDYTTNGSSFTSIATGLTSGPYFIYVSTAVAATASLNAGQRPLTYTPPTGFVALNTYNIPAGTVTTSGTFTGNASTDGPMVYLNGTPTTMTINGNAVTFGTHADKLATGFKVRSSSASYNTAGSNTYSASVVGAVFRYEDAQPNP
jgi:hypothetical protein